MSHSSKSAVFTALASNGAIALGKFGAAFWTNSGSMLAEAIHSSADCLNQILILIGMKRSEKPATKHNPLGHGKEIFFWSLLVAMLLFFVGGAYSIMEGFHRIMHPEPMENALLAAGILLFAVILEWKSFASALGALKAERGSDSLIQWAKKTKDTGLLIVTGEDAAALLGLVFALIAVGLTAITGNPIYDAVGSVVIGGLLIAMAVGLTNEIRSLIIGESAGDTVENKIREICGLNGFEVLNLITIQYGHKVMVAIKAKPVELKGMSGVELISQINRTEAAIKQALPQVGWNFFEPDVVE